MKLNDDITQCEYSMLIVWEYCVEITTGYTTEELEGSGPCDPTLRLARLVHKTRKDVGSYEMRRWAGVVGRELNRAYEYACENGTPRAGEYCVSYDFDWVPAVLEDSAGIGELLEEEEAFSYALRHYKQTMKDAIAAEKERELTHDK